MNHACVHSRTNNMRCVQWLKHTLHLLQLPDSKNTLHTSTSSSNNSYVTKPCLMTKEEMDIVPSGLHYLCMCLAQASVHADSQHPSGTQCWLTGQLSSNHRLSFFLLFVCVMVVYMHVCLLFVIACISPSKFLGLIYLIM